MDDRRRKEDGAADTSCSPMAKRVKTVCITAKHSDEKKAEPVQRVLSASAQTM